MCKMMNNVNDKLLGGVNGNDILYSYVCLYDYEHSGDYNWKVGQIKNAIPSAQILDRSLDGTTMEIKISLRAKDMKRAVDEFGGDTKFYDKDYKPKVISDYFDGFTNKSKFGEYKGRLHEITISEDDWKSMNEIRKLMWEELQELGIKDVDSCWGAHCFRNENTNKCYVVNPFNSRYGTYYDLYNFIVAKKDVPAVCQVKGAYELMKKGYKDYTIKRIGEILNKKLYIQY